MTTDADFQKSVELERKLDAFVQDAAFEDGRMTLRSLAIVMYAMTGIMTRIVGLTTPNNNAAKTLLRQFEKEILRGASGVRDGLKKEREARQRPPA